MMMSTKLSTNYQWDLWIFLLQAAGETDEDTGRARNECILEITRIFLRHPASAARSVNSFYSTISLHLPTTVRYSSTLSNFKSALKSHLFTWLFSRLHQQFRSVTAPLNRFYVLWHYRNYRRIIIITNIPTIARNMKHGWIIIDPDQLSLDRHNEYWLWPHPTLCEKQCMVKGSKNCVKTM